MRLRTVLVGVEPRDGGQVVTKTQNTLEIEGSEKPALIAETTRAADSGTTISEHQRPPRRATHRSDGRTGLPAHAGAQPAGQPARRGSDGQRRHPAEGDGERAESRDRAMVVVAERARRNRRRKIQRQPAAGDTRRFTDPTWAQQRPARAVFSRRISRGATRSTRSSIGPA